MNIATVKMTGQAVVQPARVRIPALDFVKGALVLIMVLYHWLNYFVSAQGSVYKYLRFLTPSFIFIAGYLISHIYFSSYGVMSPRVPRRLFERGLKILAVFILLNLIRIYLVPDARGSMMPSAPFSVENLVAVFATGNVAVGGSKVAAFPILVPIAYLLMFCAGLAYLCRLSRYAVHVCAALGLISIFILKFWGFESGNLEYITVGLLGVVLGYAKDETINRIASHRRLLVLAYLCDALILTIWHVTFTLQLLGIAVNVLLLYMIGFSWSSNRNVYPAIVLLGKYSLVGYISQIAVLQILARVLRPFGRGPLVLVTSFVFAFALTLLSVELLDKVRSRAPFIDRAYKFVFA